MIARDREIVNRRDAGESFTAIADHLGLSKQWVATLYYAATGKPRDHRGGKYGPYIKTPAGSEQWLPLPGCEGYEVSSHGRIRSYRVQGRRLIDGQLQLNSEPRLLGSFNASDGCGARHFGRKELITIYAVEASKAADAEIATWSADSDGGAK